MATADDVVVEFEARVAGYERDLKRAQRTFEQTTKAQESRLAAFERRMGAGFGRIVGAIATVAAAREMLRMVDAGKQIEAQLRLATRESGRFTQAQEDVRRIAMSTRSGIEETAQLYATFQRNAAQLGITQEQSARATETVTKAFQISGASAAEAAGGLRQFLQGLQSGALRGEELNSVLENAPRLAKLLADSLGVTVGQLRAMGQEGDLAAEKLIKALTDRKFTESIDAEFRELPVTFDQAMTQVESAAIITFSAFDRGGQFSTMLANFVTDGADGFADLEAAAESFGATVSTEFAGIAAVIQGVIDQVTTLVTTLNSFSGGALGGLNDFVKRFTPIGQAQQLIDIVRSSDTYQNAAAARDVELRNAAADRFFRDLQQGRDLLGNPITPASRRSGGAAATKPTRRRGPSAETLAARAERERIAAIREEGQKQQDALRAIDDVIAARAALATATDDIARLELQQLAIEQAARLSQLNTEMRIGDLTQQEYDVRAKALAEEMELRRQAIQFRREQADFEQEREKQTEALRQQNDQIALEADALSARAAIADTLEQRRMLEESALAMQQQIERSLLEQAIAEGKVADAAAARAALADRQSAEMTALEKSNQGALGRYLDSTSDVRSRAEEAAVREMQALRDGLAEGLADQLGTKNQFVKDMFAIFLDEVIFRPLAESLRSAGAGGGIGGLFSGVVAGIGSLFGGGRAIGGPVRAGRAYMVGENGPEPFIPQQNGVIVPNHRLRGDSQPVQVVVKVEANDYFDARVAGISQRVAVPIAQRTAAQIGTAVGQGVLRAMPSRMAQFSRDGT